MPMTLPPLGPVRSEGHDKNDGPQVPYYSLWTGPNGASSLASCALGGFEMKSVGGQAAPQWQRQIPDEVAGVMFMVLPVGWVGEWHESPPAAVGGAVVGALVYRDAGWLARRDGSGRHPLGSGYRHPIGRRRPGPSLRADRRRTLRDAPGPAQGTPWRR